MAEKGQLLERLEGAVTVVVTESRRHEAGETAFLDRSAADYRIATDPPG